MTTATVDTALLGPDGHQRDIPSMSECPARLLVLPEYRDCSGLGLAAKLRAPAMQKMLRLRADLGLNLAGAEIVVDLLARLDRLEAELARVRRFKPPGPPSCNTGHCPPSSAS
jgi:hypothetical protein